MTELVEKLKSDGNFIDAYIVAKNELSHNPDNPDFFRDFIDLALEIAMYNITFDERKQYTNDANTALVLFSESAIITDDVLSLIRETKNKIAQVVHAILQDEQNYLTAIDRAAQDENTANLNKLGQIYDTLQSCASQSEFDDILTSIGDVETLLHKDKFSSEQEKTYEKLTKQYSQIISRKMEEINKAELLDYNKRAVVCFNDVFKAFKTAPSRYKDESSLKAIMTSKFFAFDTSKLFNESLVFYNHVYTLVFQEVSDAMKYKLTEWALNTAKTAK